ncbi:hypothetical protein Ddc_24703 [Ditylenchus destructor]|nr:hypothetical protein Ddc_24703 [Ditylenchus destructor]
MQGYIDGKIVGVQTAKYPASKVKNGIVLFLDVDAAQVKVIVNGEDLMVWPHQVDIEKYPITNLDVIAENGRYSMTILTMIDDV